MPLSKKTKKEEKNISYLVCHMEKYHRTDVSPVEQENERDETYKADNPQIDSKRTKNNYHIVKRGGTYNEYINKRIAELNLPTKPRKDAVVMASFVIGSDKAFFNKLSPDEQEAFFASCTWFFARRYGKENIIAAIVHTDETTPHLHINIVPIHDGRLCCKDLFNRQNLMQLQTDFHEAVGKRYGLMRGKEGSQEKHLSTAEFKAKKIVEAAHEQAVAEVESVKQTAQTELTKISLAVKKAESYFDDTMQKVEAAKAEREKIVADRNAEADYSKALNDAKNGEMAKSKHGLQTQVASLVVENKRLTEENGRLTRDNADLFQQVQGNNRDNSRLIAATKAISLFRTFEPEAFARVFYRATSVLQSFLPMGEPIANIGRNRLQEIEKEIAAEKEKEQKSNKNDTNSKR